MVKIKQKVSGCLRTLTGAQDFAAMFLPVDRSQARPPPLRRPHRTHQRKCLDPGDDLNSHETKGRQVIVTGQRSPASLTRKTVGDPDFDSQATMYHGRDTAYIL